MASRSLAFDQQASYIAGWLGQALAQQIDKVEAEQAGQQSDTLVVAAHDRHDADEHDEHSMPAILFALRELVADTDPRPTVCRLEEEGQTGETAQYRAIAQAAAEILARAWLDPGPATPIYRLPPSVAHQGPPAPLPAPAA
jgi:hypothetical protein